MNTNEWRDLKTLQEVAAAQAAGDEIEYSYDSGKYWSVWFGEYWDKDTLFRARPRKPATKKVKMLCFYNGTTLFWHESGNGCFYRCRVPSEDKEIEVEK